MAARPQRDEQSFFLGFMVGGIVGAGVAILCAPRLAAQLRRRVVDSASEIGDAATERYQKVGTHVSEVMQGFTTSAEAVRDEAADAVSRGARGVEQFATASKKRKRS